MVKWVSDIKKDIVIILNIDEEDIENINDNIYIIEDTINKKNIEKLEKLGYIVETADHSFGYNSNKFIKECKYYKVMYIKINAKNIK